ncbi:MAG TPA: TRCF domain-containing protein, partial [Bacillota bacterium]|nr:TRCF domain-containing protein [Bacillota bacterium]
GFIDSVGFDMYSQMLKEAIEKRKAGKEITEIAPFEPELTLNLDAYIPDEYIKDEKQKIEIYKQFRSIDTEEDIEELKEELIDRFGDYPKEVDNLITVSSLKMYAKRERVESIMEKGKRIVMLLTEERSQEIDGSKVFEIANEFGREIQLGTENTKLKVIYTWSNETKHRRYEMVQEFIKKLSEANRVPVS